jgi:hypothetical protein
MTEQEWLACDDPKQLLDYLTGNMPEKLYDRHPSQRKLRLWVEACRKVFSSREGVLTIWRDLKEFPGELQECLATWGSEHRSRLFPLAERAHLLRDIIGNPWRPVASLTQTVECDRCNGKGERTLGKTCGACDGSGKTKGNADWLTPTAISLARAAYDHRDPATGHLDQVRLAVLADALEEAGCQDYRILEHLRQGSQEFDVGHGNVEFHDPGPHVRGCWALDLILGKE